MRKRVSLFDVEELDLVLTSTPTNTFGAFLGQDHVIYLPALHNLLSTQEISHGYIIFSNMNWQGSPKCCTDCPWTDYGMLRHEKDTCILRIWLFLSHWNETGLVGPLFQIAPEISTTRDPLLSPSGCWLSPLCICFSKAEREKLFPTVLFPLLLLLLSSVQ